MTTTEQALTAARLLARRAAQLNTGIGSCPYPVDGNHLQRAAARAWVRTYLHMRPPPPGAVDYDDDLVALAHGPDDADDTSAAPAQGLILTGG